MAGAPTAGEPEASSRDARPPPSRFRSLGSGRAQKLQLRGPRVFKSILFFLKEAKFQGAELDLLKMHLHPGGAPRGAGELASGEENSWPGRGPPRVSASALQCHLNPMQLWEQDWGRRGEWGPHAEASSAGGRGLQGFPLASPRERPLLCPIGQGPAGASS